MKVAIIEDEKQFSTLLTDHINKYSEEEGCVVDTTVFDNPIVFLDKCNANDFYEIIFPSFHSMFTVFPFTRSPFTLPFFHKSGIAGKSTSSPSIS